MIAHKSSEVYFGKLIIFNCVNAYCYAHFNIINQMLINWHVLLVEISFFFLFVLRSFINEMLLITKCIKLLKIYFTEGGFMVEQRRY